MRSACRARSVVLKYLRCHLLNLGVSKMHLTSLGRVPRLMLVGAGCRWPCLSQYSQRVSPGHRGTAALESSTWPSPHRPRGTPRQTGFLIPCAPCWSAAQRTGAERGPQHRSLVLKASSGIPHQETWATRGFSGSLELTPGNLKLLTIPKFSV